MKDLFVLLARYNEHANNKLFDCLEGSPETIVTCEAGSYFGSILGLLNHVMIADLGWLNQFRSMQPRFDALADGALDFRPPSPGKLLISDYASFVERRRRVDRVYLAFTDELSDERLREVVVRTNPRGETLNRALWQQLIQLFNHQTHHRGQISQILDASGVKHDFSNVVSVM